MNTKLTVRVPSKVIENAKRYARDHNTTLTELITAFLRRVPTETEPLNDAPVVQQLSGLLSTRVSVDDYKKHLEDKYGGR